MLDSPVTVSRVSPDAGPLAGGNEVDIQGTDLLKTTDVTLDGQPAKFMILSATELRATIPSGPSSTKEVALTVTAPDGTGGAAYWYLAPPKVTSLSQTTGTSGSSIQVSGADFIQVTAVYFGSTPATSFQVEGDRELRVVVPSGGVGTVDVVVETPGGKSAQTSVDQFTYLPG